MIVPDTAAKSPDVTGIGHADRDGQRHAAIRIDSMNWKMFIVGGILACTAALQTSVQILDPTTIRGLVFVAGVCAIVAGLRLRRRFRSHLERQVQAIIANYK